MPPKRPVNSNSAAKKANSANSGKQKAPSNAHALSDALDKVSHGSIEEGEGAEEAIEDAVKTDEGTQFFDANESSHAPVLTEEERAQIENEYKKTEEEIVTLRQVLSARIKHSNELKRKLGITPWTEITHDVSEGLSKVKQTDAYQKTATFASSTTEVVGKKLADLRNSNAFKSFGSAMYSAKAKIAASTSMDFLSGHQQTNGDQQNVSSTQPSTPATEKQPPLA